MAESGSSRLPLAEEDRQGTHELEIQYCAESEVEDLHEKNFKCHKNPEHADFIPVNYLSDRYFFKLNDKDFYNLRYFCFVASKLTARLKVKHVSLNRSKEKLKKLYNFLNIDQYPLSSYAGKTRQSFGTGLVSDIEDSGEGGLIPCPLENCPHSAEPHQVYGYIIITTAAHVVFDDNEAKRTDVEFYFDDFKDSRDVATITKHIAEGVKVKHCCVEGDFCEFLCVTHSKFLFATLSMLVLSKDMKEHFGIVLENFDFYKMLSNTVSKENMHKLQYLERVQFQKTMGPLVIHISHPHCQAKQITFGEYVACYTDTGLYKHIYTVPTCHGSSGGPVWILPVGEDGKFMWGQICGTPHSGCYDPHNKLNHSAAWTISPRFFKSEEPKNVPTEQELIRFRSGEVTNSESPSPNPASSSDKTPRRELGPAGEKRWLKYLLDSATNKLPAGMSVATALSMKKRYGREKRISDDDDVEALLALASQCEK